MNIQKLISILDKCTDPTLRKPFLETALAVELGYAVQLPSAPVESPVAHFEQFGADLVKKVIGEVNEMYPISVQVVYNMAVDVYKNRYAVCHVPSMLNPDDIAAQLSTATFKATVDPLHAKAIACEHSPLLRSDLGAFVRRFIV